MVNSSGDIIHSLFTAAQIFIGFPRYPLWTTPQVSLLYMCWIWFISWDFAVSLVSYLYRALLNRVCVERRSNGFVWGSIWLCSLKKIHPKNIVHVIKQKIVVWHPMLPFVDWAISYSLDKGNCFFVMMKINSL